MVGVCDRGFYTFHLVGRRPKIELSSEDPELTKRAWSGANSSSNAIPSTVRSWRGPYTGVEAAGTICISFGGKEPEAGLLYRVLYQPCSLATAVAAGLTPEWICIVRLVMEHPIAECPLVLNIRSALWISVSFATVLRVHERRFGRVAIRS